MTCCYCGGETDRRHVTVENWWGEHLILVTGTPAEVCTQCGEVHLEGSVAIALQNMHNTRQQHQPKRVHQVPEYAYVGG